MGPELSRRLLERRLAQQQALADFGQSALRATALAPLVREASALVAKFSPSAEEGMRTPTTSESADDDAFAAVVADMLGSVADKLNAVEASLAVSLHDSLTGLANRTLILDHLQLALARARRRSLLAAVIFLDLNDFKQVNDTQGHSTGDELLTLVAARLRPAVRPTDTLGRWGGDEFVVVCEDLEHATDADTIVQRVAAVFDTPFELRNTSQLDVSASIGVAISSADDAAGLLHLADSAMYRIKRGRKGYEAARPTAFARDAGLIKLTGLNGRLFELLADLDVDVRETLA